MAFLMGKVLHNVLKPGVLTWHLLKVQALKFVIALVNILKPIAERDRGVKRHLLFTLAYLNGI